MKPRRPPYLKNHYYHFYNRGVNRAPIFQEHDNYLFVIKKIKSYLSEFNLSMIAYCLLPNHYHFLIRQDRENPAGILPQRVFNSYTKAYNKRYQRTGTLFEGPYKVVMVENFSQLLHICRYIHANPVKHGLVKKVDLWLYSNYLEWAGARKGGLVDRDFIAEYFHSPGIYEDFVLDYLKTSTMPEEIENYLKEWGEYSTDHV